MPVLSPPRLLLQLSLQAFQLSLSHISLHSPMAQSTAGPYTSHGFLGTWSSAAFVATAVLYSKVAGWDAILGVSLFAGAIW
jgi:hypothetical protein